MKLLKIAVIGGGHLGRIHARLLSTRTDVQLVGVVDSSESVRLQVERDLTVRTWEDHFQLLGQIDAAVVAVPTIHHHKVATQLLKHGIHVLVEKPLAHTAAAARALVDSARARGVRLQVGHVERFNPAFVAALPYLEHVKYINAVRTGMFTFRSTDIGVVMDLMVHDLDLVFAITKSQVSSIDAIGASVWGQSEDIANVRLTLANGCVANLTASRASSVASRHMECFCPSGMVAIDFAQKSVQHTQLAPKLARRQFDADLCLPAEKIELMSTQFASLLSRACLPVDGQRNAIADEHEDFLTAIRTGQLPIVSGEQALQTVEIAEQICDKIMEHSWNGDTRGPIGPLASPAAWSPVDIFPNPNQSAQRRAG